MPSPLERQPFAVSICCIRSMGPLQAVRPGLLPVSFASPARPVACLREMHDVLKPGGVLVVEDGDLRLAGSIPPSAHDGFANLFGRFGPLRGLNYSLANDLYHLVKRAGFVYPKLEIHQPALLEEDDRHFLEWSVAEAAASFVNAGLTSFEHGGNLTRNAAGS
jgi:SAM-dependent methyltransferase